MILSPARNPSVISMNDSRTSVPNETFFAPRDFHPRIAPIKQHLHPDSMIGQTEAQIFSSVFSLVWASTSFALHNISVRSFGSGVQQT